MGRGGGVSKLTLGIWVDVCHFHLVQVLGVWQDAIRLLTSACGLHPGSSTPRSGSSSLSLVAREMLDTFRTNRPACDRGGSSPGLCPRPQSQREAPRLLYALRNLPSAPVLRVACSPLKRSLHGEGIPKSCSCFKVVCIPGLMFRCLAHLCGRLLCSSAQARAHALAPYNIISLL